MGVGIKVVLDSRGAVGVGIKVRLDSTRRFVFRRARRDAFFFRRVSFSVKSPKSSLMKVFTVGLELAPVCPLTRVHGLAGAKLVCFVGQVL